MQHHRYNCYRTFGADLRSVFPPGLGTPNYENMLGYLKKLDARNAARKKAKKLRAAAV